MGYIERVLQELANELVNEKLQKHQLKVEMEELKLKLEELKLELENVKNDE